MMRATRHAAAMLMMLNHQKIPATFQMLYRCCRAAMLIDARYVMTKDDATPARRYAAMMMPLFSP